MQYAPITIEISEAGHVPASVVGPRGERLTLATLPAPGRLRWNVRRKAEIVAAVDGGLLTLREACKRYGLHLDELIDWQRAVERWGWHGLRVTKLQQYRNL